MGSIASILTQLDADCSDSRTQFRPTQVRARGPTEGDLEQTAIPASWTSLRAEFVDQQEELPVQKYHQWQQIQDCQAKTDVTVVPKGAWNRASSGR